MTTIAIDPNSIDVGVLKLFLKTKCRTSTQSVKIVDAFFIFARCFHGLQVSVNVDRAVAAELHEEVSRIRQSYKNNCPELFGLYEKESCGWQRWANVKEEKDIQIQEKVVKIAYEKLMQMFKKTILASEVRLA